VCRLAALLFAVVAMLSCSVGTRAAEWIGAALGIAATFLLWFSLSSDRTMGYLGLFFYGLIWIYGGISLVVVFVFTTVLWRSERSGREDGGP